MTPSLRRSPIPTFCTLVPLAALLTCCALVPSGAGAADNLPLKVIALDPAPNYAPTRDEADAAQLTDGTYQRFPIWTRPGSVGWAKRTPVAVTIETTTKADTTYTLVLRSAQQSSAGVAPPRRIDIYCNTRFSSAWHHTGNLAHVLTDRTDGKAVDLLVPFTGCGGKQLQVLIHADGAFVMLDEITLKTAAITEATPGKAQNQRKGIDDLRTDSTRRLEAGLMQAGLKALGNTMRALGSKGSHAGLGTPWQALDQPLTAPRLSITTLPGTGARYVIGLSNADAVAHRYTLEAESDSALPARIQPLQAVLTANGHVVYDAIDAPTAAGEAITLAPRTFAFAFISEPHGAPSGTRRWQVRDDAGWTQTLTVDVALQDRIQPTAADKPRVLVWTYPSDAPIWSPANAKDTVARLSEAGVNVFEIHPRELPQPFAEKDWAARTTALKKTLALYRDRGLVLLLLGNDGWQRLSTMKDDKATRQRLASWLTLISKTLHEAGYGADDWALYPLDEPHGSSLSQLADVIDTLREIQPELRFYTNPIAGRALETSTVWRLRALKGRIDYWQARAGDAYARTAEMLGDEAHSTAALWLYSNPPAPARAALPACYRDLGRLAFDEGAHGLGFWSFSDTAKSSAWSDFDGERPDWAVVYESKDGGPFISGRRWEAFAQGISDHAALRFCARSAPGDPATTQQCRRYRAALDAVRPDCAGWW
ncbi:MAG: hypothetical protein R3F27_10970 [Gammaproteobacteria bacterium]